MVGGVPIDVGPGVRQHLGDVCKPVLGRSVEWGPAVVGGGNVDVGARLQQQMRRLGVSVVAGNVPANKPVCRQRWEKRKEGKS